MHCPFLHWELAQTSLVHPNPVIWYTLSDINLLISSSKQPPYLPIMAFWYVSNVSIIYEAFMLFYYLFWMIMSFIIHFYITFGTNLLTGGPTHIAVLLPVLVFQRKGISNGVQTEWNLRQRDFLEDYDPGDLECKPGGHRGSHEIGGRPTPPIGRAPYLVGPSSTSWPTSFAYINLRTLKTLNIKIDQEFRRRKPL